MPFFSRPIGWVILGTVGYLIYRSGKKAGEKKVEDGDEIVLDIPSRRLELKVSEQVLEERRQRWQAPEPKIKKGWLSRYASVVTSANTGAICQAR